MLLGVTKQESAQNNPKDATFHILIYYHLFSSPGTLFPFPPFWQQYARTKVFVARGAPAVMGEYRNGRISHH
jgi:hypothetical protein